MKAFRAIHKLFGIALLAVVVSVAYMLVWGNYKAVKCQEEASRMGAAQTKLAEKLEAYQQAIGFYPDSMEALSFTNSSQEIQMLSDIQKINYRRIKSGYTLSYEGVYCYKQSYTHYSESGFVKSVERENH